MKCSECHFFDGVGEPMNKGFCHRYPPTPLWQGDHAFGMWAEVDADYWCGEFKLKQIESDLPTVQEVQAIFAREYPVK